MYEVIKRDRWVFLVNHRRIGFVVADIYGNQVLCKDEFDAETTFIKWAAEQKDPNEHYVLSRG